jgi:transcriptional regulator with PAS, ATPase and Fis domain
MRPIGARAPRTASGAGLVLLYAEPLDVVAPAVPMVATPFFVGREPPPGGLRLAQAAASRIHAKFTLGPEGWTIADVGSRNGTFVDGRRIDQGALAEGAVIRIGDALFKFVSEGIEEYAPYRLDGSLAAGHERKSRAIPELVGGLRMDALAVALEAVALTDLAVLVLGETGTGKELVARAVHRLSRRRGELCAINCAAVPPTLFESELFGYRKGAFTGADRDRAGIIQAADGGTLFLDEIGDMPLDAQAKLLRVLEAREVRAIGATRPDPIDVRVVCATHRKLSALVEAGTFRGDLYARLNGCTVPLPTLRDRKEDLYQLLRHFLARAERPDFGVTFGFMLSVCDYDWPFNVRECESAVRRAVAVAAGRELDVRDLPTALQERAKSYGTRQASPQSEQRAPRAPDADELRALLARHGGNVAGVARELGKDPAQIHRWMRRHRIVPGDFRG